MSLTAGDRLGSYEILSPLGAGGMGEVYRARDTKLHRDVAVKVLNPNVAADAGALARFEHEARSASALNHPGIITIHDVGEVEGRCYIVMELVDGVTLRELLQSGCPPLRKMLDVASQLADALAKAHESGFAHRDLKPENVMITSGGHVKIVDFGLAKLTAPERLLESSADTPTVTETTPGILLGTIGYMSPEQARGRAADFRADQFAFGAILYELVTGRRAFHAPTAVETLSAIIKDEPERVSTLNPRVPAPVAWTIERCLSKDPADRYTSTRDLSRELQTLLEHVADLDTSIGRAIPLPTGARRRARLKAGAAILAAVVLGATATAWYLSGRPAGGTATAPAAPTFKQLTFRRGHVTDARFAPDGRTIIYSAAWDGGPVQLFETRLDGPESRLLAPGVAGLASISSSSELALLSGCRLDWGVCVGTLARMPLSGGAPRDVLDHVVSADWTPDGRSLAVIHVTEGEYRLEFPIGHRLYGTTGKLESLAFAPRGDRLAFIEYPVLSEASGVVKVVDLDGRATTVSSGWKTIFNLRWSPDGNEIWLAASERGRTCSLYAVPLSGATRLVFRAPGDVILVDVSRDGRLLLTQGPSRARMIWSGAGRDRELSWLDWSTAADVSADGQTVLFYEWGEGVGATPVVYLRRADGSDAVRLGDGKALALSPDGRWALALQEAAHPQLVLLPTGSGESRSLPAAGLTDFYWVKWFPDSRRILLVAAGADGIPQSYSQDIETGKLEPVAEKGMLAMLVSPDGLKILADDPLGGSYLWPVKGGEPVAVKGLEPGDRPIQWSADGRFLYVRGSDEAVLRVYRHDLTTGRRELWRELVPRDPTGVIGVATGRGELAMTPDGKIQVFTYWTAMTDLFLVEGLRR